MIQANETNVMKPRPKKKKRAKGKKRKSKATKKPTPAKKMEIELQDKKKGEVLTSLQNGASRFAAAKAGGITSVTLWRWINTDEEFAAAVKSAFMSRIGNVAEALYIKAMGGHLGAQVFYLCNKDPENWRTVAKIDQHIPIIPDAKENTESLHVSITRVGALNGPRAESLRRIVEAGFRRLGIDPDGPAQGDGDQEAAEDA